MVFYHIFQIGMFWANFVNLVNQLSKLKLKALKIAKWMHKNERIFHYEVNDENEIQIFKNLLKLNNLLHLLIIPRKFPFSLGAY